MTAKPVRNLSIVEWNDPFAWTETMRGKSWNDTVKKENQMFEKNLKKNVKQEDIEKTECALQISTNINYLEPYETECDNISIKKVGTFFLEYEVRDKMQNNLYNGVDFATNKEGDIWNIADIGNGTENYCLRFFKKGSTTAEWHIQHVAPYVIVLNNQCFFLECRKFLVYYRLVSVDAYTGKHQKIWYEEKDPKYNLSLVRGEHHTGYLVSENSGLQKAWFFHESSHSLSPCEKGKEGFFVLGGGAPNDYFFTEGRGTDSWIACGPRISRWKLPDFSQCGIPELLWVHHGLLVTRKQGVRTLWYCTPGKEPKQLFSELSMIDFNSWGIFSQQKKAQVRITCPGQYPQSAHILKDSFLLLPAPKESYGISHRKFIKSSDSTEVPYVLIKPLHSNPTTLLVTGYGAYGLSTPLSTARWKPLLDCGWAICIALVRGGGDDTLAWANAARTFKRNLAIDDFCAVIQAATQDCNLTPKRVAIFGRSAGGILVGAAAGRQPKGNHLFSALYAEVPYLDLLRTTTNSSLPLTELEFDEFGNPKERIEDLVTLGQISPVDIIPKEGYPKLFSLMRTGKNDKQVLTYEPVKWTLRARKSYQSAPKLLAIFENQGHFVHGASGLEQQAIDLELLKAWMKGWKSA
jgi:protease II